MYNFFFLKQIPPIRWRGRTVALLSSSFLWLSRLDIKWKCWIFSLQLLRFSPPRRRRRRRWMNKISNAKERWCSRRLRYLPFQLLAAKSVTLSKHERELRMVKIKFFKHQKGARQPPTDDDWYFVKKREKYQVKTMEKEINDILILIRAFWQKKNIELSRLLWSRQGRSFVCFLSSLITKMRFAITFLPD